MATKDDKITIDLGSLANNDHIPLGGIHFRSWQAAFPGLMFQHELDSMTLEEEQGNFKRMFTRLRDKFPTGESVLIARRNGTELGFIWYGPSRDPNITEGTAQILALFIDPVYWREGAGKALLEEGLVRLKAEGYKKVFLWCIEGNQRARRFYEREGFTWDASIVEDKKGTNVRYWSS